MLDSLAESAEKEIVSGGRAGKNLIGHCAPFLSKLCRNFSVMQKVISLILFHVSIGTFKMNWGRLKFWKKIYCAQNEQTLAFHFSNEHISIF